MIICAQCGQPGRHREALDTTSGQVVARGVLCDPCWEVAIVEAAELRRQFDELIAMGVNRELANEVVIERINAMSAGKDASRG